MIIGISGRAGSGKDTVGGFLRADHRFVSIAFADPMKRFCADLFDWDEEQLWGPSDLRNEPDLRYRRHDYDGIEGEFLAPRHALQTLGTEWGRDCYAEIWVEYAIRVAKKLDGAEGVEYSRVDGVFRCARPKIAGVAITDVRFPNEMRAIQDAGGKVWRVRRRGDGLAGSAAQHRSELAMNGIPDEDFDALIENDGSLAQLRDRIAKLAVFG
jgi:hypothetical protein